MTSWQVFFTGHRFELGQSFSLLKGHRSNIIASWQKAPIPFILKPSPVKKKTRRLHLLFLNSVVINPLCEMCLQGGRFHQQRSSRSSSIQHFIRTVLSAVTNLQGQISSNNEPGSSPQQHSSVQNEISA